MVEQAKAPGLLVIVDEAHHASAPSYQRVLKLLLESHCRLLGLTATPVRMSGSDTLRLANTFRKIVYQVDKKDLIEKEILSTPILETVQTKVESSASSPRPTMPTFAASANSLIGYCSGLPSTLAATASLSITS